MLCKVIPTTMLTRCARSGVLVGLLALVSCLLPGGVARAQDKKPAEADGLFITVSTPINEKSIHLIEHKIKEAAKNRKLRTVVFDFNPGGEKASTSDPWLGMKLKDYIRNLQLGKVEGMDPNLQTVAFVHGEVSKHSLLPVLACNQLIMSKESSLGPINTGQEALPAEVRDAYLKLAEPKHAKEAVEQMLKGHKVTTAEARKISLCNEEYESREDVAAALELPKKSLKENWLAGRVPVAALIPVLGKVSRDTLKSMERRINGAISAGRNLIILELDCEGGDAQEAAQYTDFLKTRLDCDGFPLTIIAWVPPSRSLGAATYLALGCSEIAMGENSCLGDFAYLDAADPETKKIQGEVLAKLAAEQHYPPLLFQASADPNVVIYRVVAKKSNENRLLTKEIYDKQKLLWNFVDELKKNNGDLVKIDTQLAHDWDVAAFTDVNSLQTLYTRYNLEPSQVRAYPDDWLDRVAEFFRQPIVKIILLLIGITGLILEVKLPGVSLPGIVAAICFVLFFWSHSFINEFTMLAVLLFILGVVLLALEIFVIPGFGVTGISGLLLIVVSVILVTVERMPVTTQDWQNLGWSIGTFCVSAVGAIALAVTIVSFLPQIPYANRLMLNPPDEGGEGAVALSALAALLGAIGMAETPLRPAGKARFGDDYLDVVSEGDYVMPGSRVQVIEIEGNRIVVKQV